MAGAFQHSAPRASVIIIRKNGKNKQPCFFGTVAIVHMNGLLLNWYDGPDKYQRPLKKTKTRTCSVDRRSSPSQWAKIENSVCDRTKAVVTKIFHFHMGRSF